MAVTEIHFKPNDNFCQCVEGMRMLPASLCLFTASKIKNIPDRNKTTWHSEQSRRNT